MFGITAQGSQPMIRMMFQKWSIALLTVFGGVLSSACVHGASTIKPRSIHASTLVGDWQGINDDEPRIFLMRVSESKKARIAMTVGPSNYVDVYAFESTALVIKQDGLVLSAKGINGMRIELRISGVALPNEGMLTGKAVLWPGDGGKMELPVKFYKRRGGYVQELLRLLQASERELSNDERG
ncbi:MAG TPA: hypothetical protein VFQ61_13465 [Polyangiaceae bacterium]|nr:hypothetical protein [Polyangiaceae bacterium]